MIPEPDQFDIHEHMPLLEEMASQSTVILELGVGKGNGSARAFTRGINRSPMVDKIYISVDSCLDYPLEVPDSPYWRIVRGQTELQSTADEVAAVLGDRKADLVLIDTYHTYEQLKAELDIWQVFAGPQTVWLLHDTFMNGQYNPMVEAAIEFCVAHPEWRYTELTQNCHGLGKIEWTT